MEYKCYRCNKLFYNKYDYKRHLNRKFKCTDKRESNVSNLKCKSGMVFQCNYCLLVCSSNSNIHRHLKNVCGVKKQLSKIEFVLEVSYTKVNYNEIIGKKSTNCGNTPTPGEKKLQIADDSLRCAYCNYMFSRKDALRRHLKDRCKTKIQMERDKEKHYQILLENKKLGNGFMKDINNSANIKNSDMYSHNVTNSHNFSNNTVNNINNTINNIKLVPFGREDLSYIPDKKSMGLIKTGFQSIPNTADYVHFNPNTPQFHNIYIPNKKEPYAMVYDGKGWKLMDLDNTLSQLYGDTLDYLKEKFKEFDGSLDDFAKKKFGKFLEYADDEEQISIIKDRLRLLIYNNKDIPIQTRKSLKTKQIE